MAGADAVVFAAGAGPGSGAARKQTMDLGGAVKLIEAAKAAGVPRYVMVSSIGADHPSAPGGPMRPYLEAKAAADAALERSGLEFTIVRPGGLTDDDGTGRVTIGQDLAYGRIPRDDVAATLLAVLDTPSTAGRAFTLLAGDVPDRRGRARGLNATRAPVDLESARAREVLRRVRSIPRGRVTTYGDLSPGAPRFAGAVLSACHDADRPVAARGARGRLAGEGRAPAQAARGGGRAVPPDRVDMRFGLVPAGRGVVEMTGMAYDTILYDVRDDGVATITLNQPDTRNALSNELLGELIDAFESARDDERVRCVVLASTHEKVFSAGGNLDRLRRRRAARAQALRHRALPAPVQADRASWASPRSAPPTATCWPARSGSRSPAT